MDLVTRLGLTQAAKPGSSFSCRERGRPPRGPSHHDDLQASLGRPTLSRRLGNEEQRGDGGGDRLYVVFEVAPEEEDEVIVRDAGEGHEEQEQDDALAENVAGRAGRDEGGAVPGCGPAAHRARPAWRCVRVCAHVRACLCVCVVGAGVELRLLFLGSRPGSPEQAHRQRCDAGLGGPQGSSEDSDGPSRPKEPERHFGV